MPWRLIGFIVVFAVFLAFITFNLGNSCDISFGFKSFPAVPVYLTVFTSFMLGLFSAIPFILSLSLKKKRLQKKKPLTKDEAAELFPDVTPELREKDSPYGID
ncbi:hypothetical protein AGMMS49928_08770 [Spirochaetia bacterium]|nr:hypothetical protein AGMMS49928_08770 [Spirochaetia bacterium]